MAITKVRASGINLSGNTTFLALPKGTTAQRPSSPVSGMIRENTTLNQLEFYNGTEWRIMKQFVSAIEYLVLAGGGGGAGCGGGGGAGAAGNSDGQSAGGDGLASTITGSSVVRGGGGGAGGDGQLNPAGEGGGANGVTYTSGSHPAHATANTGGGGGGGASRAYNRNGSSGGSGVIILRYPNGYSISFGAGVTGTESATGSDKYAVITAGTGTVSWS